MDGEDSTCGPPTSLKASLSNFHVDGKYTVYIVFSFLHFCIGLRRFRHPDTDLDSTGRGVREAMASGPKQSFGNVSARVLMTSSTAVVKACARPLAAQPHPRALLLPPPLAAALAPRSFLAPRRGEWG